MLPKPCDEDAWRSKRREILGCCVIGRFKIILVVQVTALGIVSLKVFLPFVTELIEGVFRTLFEVNVPLVQLRICVVYLIKLLLCLLWRYAYLPRSSHMGLRFEVCEELAWTIAIRMTPTPFQHHMLKER